MKNQLIYQVDAFTSHPFGGNPAGVCVLAQAAPEAWMRAVAAEMNLAETAFLYPEGPIWRLRWFTPKVEIDLCGHATLGSAHILWQTGVAPADDVLRFATRSGELTATQRDAWIELDFPATPAQPADPPPGLLEALGARATFVGRSRFDYIVEVATEAEVRALTPDFTRLRSVQTRGTVVTSRGDGEYDCVSRFFAPQVGIDEDPVTGSAHCMVGPHWAAKLGRAELRAFQASERGGELRLHMTGDRVRMSGQAVTVLRGELLVPLA